MNISSSPTLPQLLKAIDDYFECRLSDDEELKLRIILAETRFNHPGIDEARAVMGLRPLQSLHADRDGRPAEKTRFLKITRAAAVAAAVVLALLLVPRLLTPPAESTCIAYAGGNKVTDEEHIMAILQDQLEDFDSQCQNQEAEVSEELSEIGPEIEKNSDISDLFM